MSNLLNPVFRQVVFKGATKVLYKSDNHGEFILSYENVDNKFGIIRNKISQIVFELLGECGVSNHFIRSYGLKEQKVVALEMLPFLVNICATTTEDVATRLFCGQGMRLKNYLLEFKMKQQGKEYPIISQEHIINFEWMNAQQLEKVKIYSNRAMDIVYSFFKAFGCIVSAIQLEFGRSYKDGQFHDVLLADEMSPKNIKLTVDDMIDLNEDEIYMEVAKRLGILKYE